MRTRKSLLLSAGLIAIVSLLAATNAFATPPTRCTTTDFVVNVAMENTDGITSYTYTLSSPTSKNANKFFIFVKGRQVDDQGLFGDLTGTISGYASGVYLKNGETGAANCPPSSAWTTDKNDDGWCFTSVAMSNQPKLTVSERYKPEEGTTTVVLGLSNGFQVCGPILGPTTPAAPKIAGSPVKDIVANVCFHDGCCYWMTAGATDNIVKSIEPDSSTPIETVGCGGTDQPACQPCTVTDANCEQELGIAHCPALELGRDPLQGTPGGTCYSAGKRYPC